MSSIMEQQMQELYEGSDNVKKEFYEDEIIKSHLSFVEWVDINCIRNGEHEWKYRGDNFKGRYNTKEMFTTWKTLNKQ